MMTLVIMRGAAGTGKSTRVKEYWEHHGAVVCSADHYYIDKATGEYRWDPKKIGEAHAWCRGKAEGLMTAGYHTVVVDNTNIQRWQFTPYLELAERHGYFVKYDYGRAPWRANAEECASRNVHGVPVETIRKMMEQFEQ